MIMIGQQLLNGLTIGSIYALIALGYTMVYGVLKLINFAHGDLFAVGAFLGSSVILFGLSQAGLPSLIVLVLTLLLIAFFVAVLGVMIERIAYRPVRSAGRLPALVSALGVSIVLQNGIMLIWGARPRAFPSHILPEYKWNVFGILISWTQLGILLLSFLLMISLYVFVQKTRTGAALRAIAVDQQTAQLMGIHVNKLIRLVFIIGPALGGIAGVMVGLYYGQIIFTMGWSYGLKAFTVAILGGIGNIPGAMVGGLLLGVIESLAAGYISGNWKEVISFIVLILILLVRPTGLLGERVAEKI
ncbi:MAG: High-affinity branched-chain amino acid transport system permease protein LivH [Candidatus Carbobacillus altaicus]|uniref:High-affinity branched-chain amino acid transport system permease protein LivH n=1 Tax=Candidatus Carbonibacillus altaicus TaxID=2163959 RepID=A0A2R6XY61_9BACL|nr:MAG: High-affinity branched-chain amino acid transport system permease protein LivH [Candidatus Carbobacillus altaicus]